MSAADYASWKSEDAIDEHRFIDTFIELDNLAFETGVALDNFDDRYYTETSAWVDEFNSTPGMPYTIEWDER